MWQFLSPLIGPTVNKILDLIPNVNERAKAKEKFEFELMTAVNAASEAQTKINLAEAAHRSVFVAGWRPSIGWTCSLALFYSFVAHPILSWYVAIYHPEIASLPKLEIGELMTLVLGMLGLGGMRSYEKNKGVTR